MKLKHILILQNKIDLVKETQAREQYDQILRFVQGKVAMRKQRVLTSIAMVEQFSALDSNLHSDGRIVRMWVRILTATVVLMSLSKTLNHICFSPPRSKWVPCEGRVGLLCLISPICAKTAAIEVYTALGAERVSGMIYKPDEQG